MLPFVILDNFCYNKALTEIYHFILVRLLELNYSRFYHTSLVLLITQGKINPCKINPSNTVKNENIQPNISLISYFLAALSLSHRATSKAPLAKIDRLVAVWLSSMYSPSK